MWQTKFLKKVKLLSQFECGLQLLPQFFFFLQACLRNGKDKNWNTSRMLVPFHETVTHLIDPSFERPNQAQAWLTALMVVIR